MHALLSLSRNTFREAIRDKILYTIFFFGFLFVAAAPLAGAIAAGQEERVVLNFGLAMLHIFGLFLTIFVGSRLIFNEIDRKTIFLLVPKPVSRAVILLSKFFGLAAVLFCTTVLMSIVFFLVVSFSWKLLLTIAFLYLSLLLLLALVLFFSAFMAPLLASVSGVLMFAVGNMTFGLKVFADHSGGPILKFLAQILYFFLPNFSQLNLKNYVLTAVPYGPTDFLWILLSTCLFIVLFLFFATRIFARREFE